MFDIGAGELLVIGVVALVVIGPKELPGVLRQAGKFTSKMRQMAGEFRSQFDEAMREADLEETRKKFASVTDSLTAAAELNPVNTIKSELQQAGAAIHSAVDMSASPAATTPVPAFAAPAVESAKPVRKRVAKTEVVVDVKPVKKTAAKRVASATVAKSRTAKNESVKS